jgi:hypothetical protein
MKRIANPAWGLAFAAALLSGSATTPDGEPGLHYLCAGCKKFFRHIRKYLRAMGTLIENDLPVSLCHAGHRRALDRHGQEVPRGLNVLAHTQLPSHNGRTGKEIV